MSGRLLFFVPLAVIALFLGAIALPKLLQLAGAQPTSEGVFIARQRHVQALEQTGQHLGAALHLIELDAQAPLDLLAEELRLSHQALMAITGEYTPDDLLGAIFSSFCIGK